MRRALWWLAMACAGPLSAAQAQQASVRINADSVTVGERFVLTVRVISDEGTVVPPPLGSVDGLDLLRQIGAGTETGAPLPPGARLDSFVYEAAAFAVDSLVVPPLTVGLVRGADTARVMTSPTVLPMRALVRDSTARLRPTHPLASFALPWAWLAAFAVLGLLAGALLYRRWRRRPKAQPVAAPVAPPQTAREQYLTALTALGARLPGTVPEARAFALDLSAAVRTYAEAQTGLSTREMTTRTFVRALERLERAQKVAPEAPALARRTLAVADLGRYASTCPPPPESEAALAAARHLAAALEPLPTKPRGSVLPAEGASRRARQAPSEFAPPTVPQPDAAS